MPEIAEESMFYKGYKYLYYRIYSWNLRAWGDSDMPQYNALFAVTALVGLNLMTMPTAIDALTGGHLVPDSGAAKIVLFLIFGVVLVVGYFCLVSDGKYKTIAKEFASESTANRRTKLLAIWIYVIGTFAAFFGFASLISR